MLAHLPMSRMVGTISASGLSPPTVPPVVCSRQWQKSATQVKDLKNSIQSRPVMTYDDELSGEKSKYILWVDIKAMPPVRQREGNLQTYCYSNE